VGQIRLPAELTDLGCERLAAETSFARLLIVDKPNAPLHFWTHLIWFLKLFFQKYRRRASSGGCFWPAERCFSSASHAMRNRRRLARIAAKMLRSVYVRLNIAVEFEDILGKRALELSSARLRGYPRDRQSRPATTPRGFRSRPPIINIEPSASQHPLISMCRTPGLGVDPRWTGTEGSPHFDPKFEWS
jgi:hypothetical protein